MFRFLRNILILSLLVLIPLISAEVYVRSLPNPSRYKHQYMLRHSAEVQTLILGNSHTFYGINPSLLGPHTFSLAQPTQSYRYDYYLLTHYPLPHLRTLILPCSYTSLFEDLEAEPQLQSWAVCYRLYMDCDIHGPLSRYAFECLHIGAFKEKLQSLWKPAQLHWDSLGFGTSFGHQSLLSQGQDNGQARAEINTYPTMQSTPFLVAQLDSICQWCTTHNVRLLILTTPTSPSFRNHCSKTQVQEWHRRLNEVLSRHPQVEYHNFWADTTFHTPDFYDADHLNMTGAHKLTQKIKEILQH